MVVVVVVGAAEPGGRPGRACSLPPAAAAFGAALVWRWMVALSSVHGCVCGQGLRPAGTSHILPALANMALPRVVSGQGWRSL